MLTYADVFRRMLVVLMLVYTLAVHVLDPQEGDFIVDLCAAPGGKACMIAQRMRYMLSSQHPLISCLLSA
jgi:hypothetical protein